MITSEYETYFSSDSTVDHQLLIVVSDGRTLTNEDILQEQFSIEETLSNDTSFKFGGCVSSCLRARVVTTEPLIGLSITVKMRIAECANDFVIGSYKVSSDTPTSDRAYRDIVAYDILADVLNEDVTTWYDEVFANGDVTIKALRDSLFEHLGVTQATTTLINDNEEIAKTISTENNTVSCKDILTSICEINGVFGHISRTGSFNYISLSSGDPVKTYDRYIEGTVSYKDYETSAITGVKCEGISVGTDTNVYQLKNELTEGIYQKTVVCTNLLNKVSGVSFRPFNGKTYGDFCVEVGDKVSITTLSTTITSYVMNRTISGIQALRDYLTATGSKDLTEDNNGIYANLSQIQDTEVIKITSDGDLVSCAVTKDTSRGRDFTIKGNNIEFIANGELDLTAENLQITSSNFSVTEDGTMSCSSANITGGSIHMETNNDSEDAITLNYTSEGDEGWKEQNKATLFPKGIYSEKYDIPPSSVSDQARISRAYFLNSNSSGLPELGIAMGTQDEYISHGGSIPVAQKFWVTPTLLRSNILSQFTNLWTTKNFSITDDTAGVTYPSLDSVRFASGQSYSLSKMILTGFLTSSNKQINFYIPLNRMIGGDVTSVTISGKFKVRVDGTYVIGSGSAYATLQSKGTVTTYIAGGTESYGGVVYCKGNGVRIELVMTSATSATNNAPAVIDCDTDAKITFN